MILGPALYCWTNSLLRVACLGSPLSDFNDFGVYSRVFKVSDMIEFVFKIIVCQGHSQKVILKVKF